jgi:hypothetical protein
LFFCAPPILCLDGYRSGFDAATVAYGKQYDHSRFARLGGRPERTAPSLRGNSDNPLSQRCAKIIAFGTSLNKGEDFQGVSVLLLRDPSGYSKQMQMMRLVPDTTGCQHDLESEAEMLQIEGKLVLHSPKCDYYVFKGTDNAGFLTGLDQIGKMFDS